MTTSALRATLDVVSGDPVRLTMTLSNEGDEPVALRFPTGQSAEFVVSDATGEEVWRWSEGRMFTQALREETLDPDDRASYEATWDAPEPDEYLARAILAAEDLDVEATATFRV